MCFCQYQFNKFHSFRRDDVPTSKGLLQLALKSKMDLTVSCTYVKNSQKSSVEANILLAVCAELLIKKEFESDQQIQSDVVKVLQLMRSCGRDVASVFSSLKEIEVSNEEASLMAETTKTFWNILRTEVMQDPEFESDTTSSKRWRKSLKLKLGELVSSFSKTDHACTFDVLAQLLFGLFQTISACDSDIQWSKMEKIWNKLIEWTVSSIMEETDQTTGLELIDQMEFMIQKSLAAKKWREKCNFTQYLTEKRSRYLTEAEKPQNTEDKHAADDNEAITDRENSSVEINNDYLKLLNQCSIGGEDKKGVKSIKRDLRRCWDKLVVFVLKNHYKSPAVIRLLAKALHLATPKTQMDDR